MKAFLDEKAIDQKDVAVLIPTTAATLSRILNGKQVPKLGLARSIARTFGDLGCTVNAGHLVLEAMDEEPAQVA